MLLVVLYVIIVIALFAYILFYPKKEGFQSNNNSTTSVSTSEEQIDTTATSSSNTISDFNEMESIELDFSIIEQGEKFERNKKSEELNECLGKYVNKDVKAFRDVSELMFNKLPDCDNIYNATEVSLDKEYNEQMTYW